MSKERKPLLLVGQAPCGQRPRAPALCPSTRSGRRLAELAGVGSVREIADAVNLLRRFPGSAGPKGDLFPIEEARRAARRLAGRMRARRATLLLGGNVARAFGVGGTDFLEWTEVRGARACVFPHPSGISHWWNDPRNVRRARRFLRRLAMEARGW